MHSDLWRKPTTWGIDCDVLLYSVGFASQTNLDKTGERVEEARPLISADQACAQLVNAIERIAHAAGCKSSYIYLTGDANYRTHYSLSDHPYKGHRTSEKPLYYDILKTFALGDLGAIVCEGCEADDLLAQGAYFNGDGIATIDKDLNMVAGWHYNWMKDKLFLVSPENGMRFFYRQLLTGDPADNIPGLFRLTGRKATAKLLDPICEMEKELDMWEYVVSVYHEHGGTERDWIHTLTCTGTQLWMDIYGDKLWYPPRSVV